MRKIHPKDELVHELVSLMLDHGEWEPLDTWGNGAVVLKDAQQFTYAAKVSNIIAAIWDSAHAQGVADSTAETATLNPYRKVL